MAQAPRERGGLDVSRWTSSIQFSCRLLYISEESIQHSCLTVSLKVVSLFSFAGVDRNGKDKLHTFFLSFLFFSVFPVIIFKCVLLLLDRAAK